MANMHTVKSFDEDLRQLRSYISQMGGLAEAQIMGAIEALATRNPEMARKVVEGDRALDDLEVAAERNAIQTIARRQPLADDLREVISALKIAALLERIGDYAKNIAKRATVLSQVEPIEPLVIVPEMGRTVTHMLKDVLDAYGSRDADKARAVWSRDKSVDDFYNSLFRSLLTYMMENPQQITPSTHVMFIAKNLERIGDHATNIAEIIYFNVTGSYMDTDRPKGDETAYALVNKSAE
ncbi:phosphate signaling complex protein PhoU [Pedomonas mirosovicensis]|uniref:phosphate signaling complex protein PhoU n=1 Tax=Pedomonas mirosovicensis TaxID=2908641 RepID=UPI0021696207|nr:phosphate signaling complex protein PhoU [Pedomonas mirosovicensis]MCH8684328.1 phosphate signaling complex protein PhoU [Pedomonas mirosovicensis]